MTTTSGAETDAPRATGGVTSRGAQRKTEIVEAAVRVIATVGLSGLSMRAVAAEAGMPLGALSYYFTGKSDLVLESFRALSAAEIDRVVTAAHALDPAMAPTEMADRLADLVLDGLVRAHGTIVARHELVVEASRKDELAPLFAAWYVTMVPPLAGLFRQLGSREPDVDARLVLATMAGLEADHIYRPLRPADKRSIRAVLRRLFRVLADARSAPGA
ncbi:TetR/AcrR family transcriptional regulator [Blastococcus sp. SYSU D00669]